MSERAVLIPVEVAPGNIAEHCILCIIEEAIAHIPEGSNENVVECAIPHAFYICVENVVKGAVTDRIDVRVEHVEEGAIFYFVQMAGSVDVSEGGAGGGCYRAVSHFPKGAIEDGEESTLVHLI